MSKKRVRKSPAFVTSKAETIKGMTGKEQVSLVVTLIQSLPKENASRWDSVNDYPKISEVKRLVANSEGVMDFSLKVFKRYCPEPVK